jgi:hypothetical protein
MVIGKFQRLIEGDVQPARHRNLLAGQPLWGRRIVLQHITDVAGLPPRVADHMAGVGDLQRRQFIDMRVDDGGEGTQRGRPFGRRQTGPIPLSRLGTRYCVIDACLVGLLDGA